MTAMHTVFEKLVFVFQIFLFLFCTFLFLFLWHRQVRLAGTCFMFSGCPFIRSSIHL